MRVFWATPPPKYMMSPDDSKYFANFFGAGHGEPILEGQMYHQDG